MSTVKGDRPLLKYVTKSEFMKLVSKDLLQNNNFE